MKIKKIGYVSRVLSGVLFALLLLAMVFPFADGTPESSAVNGISNPATSVITVDTERDSANLGIAPGTFNATTDEQSAAFSVTTDNFSGYVVSLDVADNGILVNEDSNTPHVLNTIATDMTSAEFNNSTNNDRWGIKPNKYYNSSAGQTVVNTGDSALFFPTDVTLCIDKTSAANSNANSYTVGLGARVDILTQSGLYKGTVNIYVVGNPMSHTITYNKNTTVNVANMPNADTIHGTGIEYATLSSNVPSRSGYTFLGWCAMQPSARYGVDSCGGTVYQPGDEFGLDYTSNANDVLYAMWQTGTKSYIQDVTPETCPIVPTVVFDYRDEAAYVIKKMPDGNCWMLENLRLGDSENAIELTPEYTNTETNFTLPASTNENFSSFTTAQINTDSKNKTAYSGNIGEGKVGFYYNYCAATAGTYCYGENEATGNTSFDICPKGWHLPTGGEAGEYRALYTQYNEDILFVEGFRAPYSGFYAINNVTGLNDYGVFWTSTPANDNIYALTLAVERANGMPTDSIIERSVGASLRCIKEIPKRYMQDVAEWKDELGTNESTLAIDIRDGKEYWVTKLETDPAIADNRADCIGTGSERVCTQLWMTQDLDINLSSDVTYTHADTDLGWTNNDENVIWNPASTLIDQDNYINTNTADQSFIGTGRYYYTSGTNSNDPSYDLAECIARGHTEYDCRHYSIGNYYNFYTANALGATSGGVQVPVGNDNYTKAPNSVCPAGWRLPDGYLSDGAHSEYDYLLYHNGITTTYATQNISVTYTEDGFKNMRLEPLWLVRAGGIARGGVYNHYRNAYYWSNTINNSAKAQGGVYATPTGIQFGGNADRYSGYHVRCVARAELDHIYIQDVTPSTCPTTPTTVYDKRDEEAYTIQKLEDGNCWLLDNLRLDLATTRDLTTTDTNITSDWTAPLDIATWVNSYDIPKMNADYKNASGTGGYEAGKYGAYYNYCAATAGTYCYEEGAGNGDATQDICPKGWRMPTGGASGEYQTLYAAYNSDYSSFVKALHTPLSGYYWYYNNKYAKGQGVYGEFWSSTDTIIDDYDYKYYLDLLQTDVYFEDVMDHGEGASVRCIAKNETEPEPEKTYIQDITIDTCPTEPTTVYDNRDEEAYTIQKLEDGNCWLLDNLRLDLTDSTVQNKLSSSNTNASDTTLNYLKNGGGTTSDQYATAGVSDTWTTDSYSAPLVNTTDKNTTGTGGYEDGKYGVYYNYCAATAGSYCYGDGANSGTSSGNATEDICPKGWRMPTGDASGEYQTLFGEYYNMVTYFQSGFRTPLSGIISGGTAVSQGTHGGYWSATRISDSNMYALRVDSASIDPHNGGPRTNGGSIRCTISPDISSVTTMQEFGNLNVSQKTSVMNSMVEGQAYTLTDARDSQVYTVKKANNQIWMARNLAIGCDGSGDTYGNNTSNITLTKNDSNVDIDWSTPTADLAVGSLDYTTTPRMTCSSDHGAWYNFAAVTAGTITGDNNTDESVYDVCPVGWRIPTLTEQQSVLGYAVELNADTSGEYYGGAFVNSGRGLWWSSTARDGMNRYNLNYYGGTDFGIGTGCNRSAYGAYIRCVAK